MSRAAAILLLKDSGASFIIEGESPPQNRIERWGRALAETGKYPLTNEELLRLQKIVIGDRRFVSPGFRNRGGFVGEHDRDTGVPIPEHISARYDDVAPLVQGLVEYVNRWEGLIDPVIAAASAAFGFAYIHPFFDATPHAEFLFSCVLRTIETDLPEETAFLENYSRFKSEVAILVDMPSHTINLLFRFLRQGDGTLSKRARNGEFADLRDEEVEQVEKLYGKLFGDG